MSEDDRFEAALRAFAEVLRSEPAAPAQDAPAAEAAPAEAALTPGQEHALREQQQAATEPAGLTREDVDRIEGEGREAVLAHMDEIDAAMRRGI